LKKNLTIVTIVKNDAEGLVRTKQSFVLAKNSINWIIVTPNEPGLTLQLARDLLQNREVEKLIIDQGRGIYQAMNLALANIDADQWVWFLNAGDEVASTLTIKQIQETLVGTTAQWIYGGFHLANQDREILSYCPAPQIFDARKQLFSKSFVSHQSVIMKSNLMKSLNGFSEQFKVAADWDLLVRAALISNPCRVDYAIAIFYLGGFSTVNRLTSNRELLALRSKYLSKIFLPYSLWWYFYRILRNRCVIFLERFNPRYLNLLRRLKVYFWQK
jgi:putative colanic acid biosynthesis glycosyltransferase